MSDSVALDVSSAGVRARAKSSRTSASRARRAWLLCASSLVAILTGGCGEDPQKQRAVYNEAVRALEQDRTTLKNLQVERERVYGEYLVHDFEGWVWGGNLQPRKLWGLTDDEDSFGVPTSLTWYLYRKLPKPWPLQWERLLTDRGELLPWTDRTRGDLYRRRVLFRYEKLLRDLDDRLSLQRDRVKNAENWVRLNTPTEE